MTRFVFAVLLLVVLGDAKPKNQKPDPRLKTKPHVWKTSADDLEHVKAAAPTKGTWAEKDFGKGVETVASKALEAREAAKAREQKKHFDHCKGCSKDYNKDYTKDHHHYHYYIKGSQVLEGKCYDVGLSGQAACKDSLFGQAACEVGLSGQAALGEIPQRRKPQGC